MPATLKTTKIIFAVCFCLIVILGGVKAGFRLPALAVYPFMGLACFIGMWAALRMEKMRRAKSAKALRDGRFTD